MKIALIAGQDFVIGSVPLCLRRLVADVPSHEDHSSNQQDGSTCQRFFHSVTAAFGRIRMSDRHSSIFSFLRSTALTTFRQSRRLCNQPSQRPAHSRITFSVRSVLTPDVFFGQASQKATLSGKAFASARKSRANSASEVTKSTATFALAAPSTSSAPAGSGSSLRSNRAGAFTNTNE